MELTLSQLRSITLGALKIEQEADGFHFYRITPTQTAAFTRATESFGPKCLTTSGIRLDFYTDSSHLSLSWHKARTTTRKMLYFDVLVDGDPVINCGTLDCGKQPEGSFSISLPEGSHHLQVFFPTLTIPVLRSVVLDDGASLTPHLPSMRILIHGDSITQGYDAQHPSGCYANLVARHYDAEIVNQAVGGACFNPEVVEPVGDFDFVLVSYGSNDWSKKNPDAFKADAAAFMYRLNEFYGHVPRFLVLPVWRGDIDERTDTAGDFMVCREWLRKIASDRSIQPLDDFDLLPHDTHLLSDGYLHPNDQGFIPYAQRLIALLDARLPY
ncbi:MAG: SGNH/GDSL hydrolase family protein [Ruminococcaceae bacterium]|nr:SGNH/GDSL hydrolase family protein [Oscillospiraceae bacterium]